MAHSDYLASTFSIIAYDPRAQEWGVAVESRAFAVGKMVPWAMAGVGAVATQSWVNISYGARGLALLKRGHDPREVIQHLVGSDKQGARRQLAVMDAQGRTANYTGGECMAWAGGIAEPNVSVQGNILAGERVLKAMLAAYKKTRGKLAERLLAALAAGQRAGGDRRGQQSAALVVVRAESDENGVGDRYIDLRVDDHRTPIAELERIYRVWEREMYPFQEANHVNALLKHKRYARAQKLHREYVATVERLARKYPQDAELCNTVAWQLSRNALGLDAALQYAKRAAKLKPRDANIADTLAEVHFQRGEYAQALAIAQSLVKRFPERNDFQQQLAKFDKAAKRRRRG